MDSESTNLPSGGSDNARPSDDLSKSLTLDDAASLDVAFDDDEDQGEFAQEAGTETDRETDEPPESQEADEEGETEKADAGEAETPKEETPVITLKDGTKLTLEEVQSGYMRDRDRWAQRQGDAFVAISREIASELETAGIAKDKIWLIPCTLDTQHFHPLKDPQRGPLRSQLGMQDGFWVCYAGRLVAEKGLNVPLKAWETVIRCTPDARLVIVGDGDPRSHLEDLAEIRGIEHRVRFTGAVGDTAQYLQASDVYVQPSFTEGLPISVLEAMACGLPVIATGVGGVTDLLSNGINGIVIPPHDPDSLSYGLVELLSNLNLRLSLGGQARQDVTAYCAIDKVGEAHLELYRRLVDGYSHSSHPGAEMPVS